MMLEESIRILAMQEEILQFSHFTNEDAWELGSLMVSEAARNRLPGGDQHPAELTDIQYSSMVSKGRTIITSSG